VSPPMEPNAEVSGPGAAPTDATGLREAVLPRSERPTRRRDLHRRRIIMGDDRGYAGRSRVEPAEAPERGLFWNANVSAVGERPVCCRERGSPLSCQGCDSPGPCAQMHLETRKKNSVDEGARGAHDARVYEYLMIRRGYAMGVARRRGRNGEQS
jgi:hypothetical protein